MKFEKISIRNFRNFENIEIGISNKNIFFGLNDIGKTNFLYAMRYVFDKDIRKNGFLDSDFHKKNVEIISEIPAEGNSGKKSTATIKRILEAIANAENQTVFDTTVNSLCDYLGYETRPEHLNKLFSTVSNKKYHVAFNTDIYQNIAITFHSSKGLEFDQVILFAGDYNLSDMSGIYNHYVAVTRAKEKVVIVKCSDYYANRFESNLSQIFALSGLKTCNLVTYK